MVVIPQDTFIGKRKDKTSSNTGTDEVSFMQQSLTMVSGLVKLIEVIGQNTLSKWVM